MLVEHQRGFQLAFERHLDRVRKGEAPWRDVDYLAPWLGMTAGPAGQPLVRLDLAIDGLRPRVRLLFKQRAISVLLPLVDGAQFGLLAARTDSAAQRRSHLRGYSARRPHGVTSSASWGW